MNSDYISEAAQLFACRIKTPIPSIVGPAMVLDGHDASSPHQVEQFLAAAPDLRLSEAVLAPRQ